MKHGIQRIIAQRTGLSHGYISLLLSGQRVAPWSTAKSLAEVTGTDPVDWVEKRLEKLKREITTHFEVQGIQAEIDKLKDNLKELANEQP